MFDGLRMRGIRTLMATLFVAALVAGGCSGPSFLVTPVSGRRALVETELSRDSLFAFDKIALIDVSGVILNTPKPQLLGYGEHPVSLLLEQLDKARRDAAVKAVVLRINSPGGSVVASELMHDEIIHFKKSGKPIIAMLMDVAASGGYYIACACDEILAQPSTITGSIGVIMQMVDVTGTMDLIGLQSRAITSGRFKDTGSPFRAMRAEERELFERIVADMYERFVAVVVAGRGNLDEPTVRRLSDGRIFTGTQALEAGLIDRIATLRDSIELAKELSGARRVRVVAYARPLSYRPNYYAHAPDRFAGGVNLINIDASILTGLGTPQFMYLWAPGR